MVEYQPTNFDLFVRNDRGVESRAILSSLFFARTSRRDLPNIADRFAWLQQDPFTAGLCEPCALDSVMPRPPPLVPLTGPAAFAFLALLVDRVDPIDTVRRCVYDHVSARCRLNQRHRSFALVAEIVRRFRHPQIRDAEAAAFRL